MSVEPWSRAARNRARPLVLAAGLSWLPYLAEPLASGSGQARLQSCLLIALTVLPLGVCQPVLFCRACRTIAGLMFGSLLLTGPYVICLAPLFAVFCPAGVMLIIAGRRDLGPTGAGIGIALACIPLLTYLALQHTSPFQ